MHAPDELADGEQAGHHFLARLRRARLVPHDAPVAVHAHAAHRVVRHGRDPPHVIRILLARVAGHRVDAARATTLAQKRRAGERRLVGERAPFRLRRRRVVRAKRVSQRRLHRALPAVRARRGVGHPRAAHLALEPRRDARDALDARQEALVDVQRHVLLRLRRGVRVEQKRKLQRLAFVHALAARRRLGARLGEHAPADIVARPELVREAAPVAREQQPARAAQNLGGESLHARARVLRVHEPGGVDLHVRHVHRRRAQRERHLVPVARRARRVGRRERRRQRCVRAQKRVRARRVAGEPAGGEYHRRRHRRVEDGGPKPFRGRTAVVFVFVFVGTHRMCVGAVLDAASARLRDGRPAHAARRAVRADDNLRRARAFFQRESAARRVLLARLLRRRDEHRARHAARRAVRARVRVPAEPPDQAQINAHAPLEPRQGRAAALRQRGEVLHGLGRGGRGGLLARLRAARV